MQKAIVFLTFAIMVACLGCGESPERLLNQVDQQVRQGLPMGTARSDVIDFLKARNISIQDSRDINYYKGPQTIWGQVAASGKYDVVKTEATLIFEFDDKGILTAYQMKKQMVGP